MCQSSFGRVRSYRGPGRGGTAASTALGAQQLVDVRMPNPVDLTTIHFRRNAFRIPVGEQPNGDDYLVHPSRDTGTQAVWPLRFIHQAGDSSSGKGGQPLVERR